MLIQFSYYTQYHAAEKIAEKECGSERAFLTPEEEDIVF
jgi:hypothetical protein